MKPYNVLDRSQIQDESGKISPRFVPRDNSGFIPDGRYTVLREDGRPLLEITYRQGVVHGTYVDFWSSGKVACEGQYQDGTPDGMWHYYSPDGTLREVIRFKDGKEIWSSLG